jgi:hypothetical protein
MPLKRGNPNWQLPIGPSPVLAIELERQVRRLELTADMYISSAALHSWCSKTRIGAMSRNGCLPSGECPRIRAYSHEPICVRVSTRSEDYRISKTSLPQRHEQRKVDKLLLRLSKMKPTLPKPVPIAPGKSAIPADCASNLQVFFST